MNFLKRVVSSLRYYWKKTVSTILIFLLLFTFVLAGLSIRAACESSLAQVRSNVDTDILLTNTTEVFQTAERNNISLEIVQAVGALEGIRGWDFSVVLDGFARDFQAQGPKEAGEQLEGVPDIRLYGETDSSLGDAFRSGAASLLEGRHLVQGDSGCALLHKALAKSNRIKLGDTVRIRGQYQEKPTDFQVIGLYATAFEGAPSQGIAALPENGVYIPAEDALSLTEGEQAAKAVFYLRDPEQASRTVQQAQAIVDEQEGRLFFTIEDEEYRRIAGPLTHLTGIMTVMVWAAMVLGATILPLMTFLSLGAREREIGILLAMGEHKGKILAQLILEILLPMLCAVTLSACIGDFAGRQAALALNVEIPEGSTYQQIAPVYGCSLLLVLLASFTVCQKVLRFLPAKILREE